MCEVVQGVLIRRDIAPWLYNITLTEKQREDGHIRPTEQMLTRIHDLDSRPITVARDVGHRLPRKLALGLPGDTLEVEPDGVTINGRRFANSASAERDSQGRPLDHVP